MSRAFTKEVDDAPVAAVKKLGAPVPDPNYVTPAGLAHARAELEQTADDDRRRELADHLATAQAIEPTDRGEVGLGARVTVTGAVYVLVGAIEADPKHGRVFWRSPIGQALWRARVGDTVRLPRGEVEIIAIEY
jgi:transcription elongation factor GreB